MIKLSFTLNNAKKLGATAELIYNIPDSVQQQATQSNPEQQPTANYFSEPIQRESVGKKTISFKKAKVFRMISSALGIIALIALLFIPCLYGESYDPTLGEHGGYVEVDYTLISIYSKAIEYLAEVGFKFSVNVIFNALPLIFAIMLLPFAISCIAQLINSIKSLNNTQKPSESKAVRANAVLFIMAPYMCQFSYRASFRLTNCIIILAILILSIIFETISNKLIND